MRNFEERRAEVFRRGEEKRAMRRKMRNRIVSFCIPLCLCVGAWAIAALPGAENSAGDMAPEANVGGMGGLVMGSTGHTYVAVEIQTGDALYHSVTGKDDATMFYDSFSSIYTGATPDAGSGAPESSTLETYGDDLHNELTGGTPQVFTITFIREDGTADIYTLKGNILSHNGKDVVLTDQQLSLLLRLH